jgi:hypothetical protein
MVYDTQPDTNNNFFYLYSLGIFLVVILLSWMIYYFYQYINEKSLKIDQLENDLRDKQLKIDQLENDLRDKQLKIDQLENDLIDKQLENDLIDKQLEIGKLESKLKNNQLEIGKLESKLKNNQLEISKLKNDLIDNQLKNNLIEKIKEYHLYLFQKEENILNKYKKQNTENYSKETFKKLYRKIEEEKFSTNKISNIDNEKININNIKVINNQLDLKNLTTSNKKESTLNLSEALRNIKSRITWIIIYINILNRDNEIKERNLFDVIQIRDISNRRSNYNRTKKEGEPLKGLEEFKYSIKDDIFFRCYDSKCVDCPGYSKQLLSLCQIYILEKKELKKEIEMITSIEQIIKECIENYNKLYSLLY